MKNCNESKDFLNKLSQFQPNFDAKSRSLALCSAAVAIADDAIVKQSFQKAMELGVEVDSIYEILLQSYLFLGFPRMLSAAECFRELFPDYDVNVEPESNTNHFEIWRNRGMKLCREVYGENFDKLSQRIRLFSEEIFDWMILEGYGKVLSRPGLSIKDRELGVVACLMVDNRPKQLYSHIRGALNVGVSEKLLAASIGDISLLTGAEDATAVSFMKRLRTDV